MTLKDNSETMYESYTNKAQFQNISTSSDSLAGISDQVCSYNLYLLLPYFCNLCFRMIVIR